METNLLYIISFFIFLLLDLQFVYPQYQNCSAAFNCGNITGIGYPFWGSNRPEYCGHPKFQLNCSNETAKIKIEELNYKVVDINTNSKNLKVVREDHIGNICPEPHVNTSLDWQVLSYASDTRNISLYYGCPPTSSMISTSQYSTNFTCNDSSGFFMTGDLGNSSLINYGGLCTTKVLVPASESAIMTLESNIRLSLDNLVVALDQGFGLQWDVSNSICETCSLSGGVCGYNNSSSFICYCSDAQHQSFTCGGTTSNQNQPQSGGRDRRLQVIIAIGVSSAFPIIILALFGCYYCFMRKRGTWRSNQKNKVEDNVEDFIMNYQSLMPQRYSYPDVQKMTNSFKHKLGQGGFGGVYHGNLSDGRPVAVKLLLKSTDDGEDFINEVSSISRTSHVNVVTLLGFCYQRTIRALVYEYMPNGSLDKFIFHQDEKMQHLDQKTLFEIAIGIARGLEYLHRGCNTRIVHFDIKPHNILLDKDLCPKISDFGLAKLCKGKESIVSMLGARGTAGYIAPEVFMRGYGGVSYKSDVYSYGMMILEMFAGKSVVVSDGTRTNSDDYFPDFVYKYLEREEIDENIGDEEEKIVKRRVNIVGLWCIQTNPTNRPSMTKVIEMLEGDIESLQIPPQPRLIPSTKPIELSSSS
ncbi:LEAF RUST 10 DISEASE-RESISTANCEUS RECEPTOR-LIKE PROTEIN KINASE-like 2.1 [Euphorbia lathyris]|uniref:LEAF RUST 10 DISEASE-RESISTANCEUS RECEPTOR-LIKE PROTEIN KINASE-like 2.1 n=1 Tax=Euphorbia lathyris TaxID=212925 RepID=UPI0033141A6F